jgi:hypothetical protein
MKIRSGFTIRSVSAAAGAALLAGAVVLATGDDKKPSISLRASPTTGFSPLKVFLSVEIKGGPDDFANYYCPTIEWVWGDDTRAESTSDCEPYEAGKSEIRRRYSVTRVFQTSGNFKVEFRLKQKNKVVGAGSTTVQVRPGLRDGGGESLIANR